MNLAPVYQGSAAKRLCRRCSARRTTSDVVESELRAAEAETDATLYPAVELLDVRKQEVLKEILTRTYATEEVGVEFCVAKIFNACVPDSDPPSAERHSVHSPEWSFRSCIRAQYE